jgi:hypothetical protein
LLERSKFTAPEFLFATGESSKVVIQTLEAGQRIYAPGLYRNAAYLAPFRAPHRTVDVNSALFRFLLHFANYLLRTHSIPFANFVECGAFSVLLTALSSSDHHTRAVAYATLSEAYDLNLDRKEWQFHKEFCLFLESLLNSIDTPCKRFPHLISHFLTCAATVLTKPGHIVFGPLVKFIAGAQSLRLTGVPLFTELFGQDGIDHRQSRNYILKMLQAGVAEPADVELLKKAKVVDRLMAYFSSPLADLGSREAILAIIGQAAALEKLDGVGLWAYSVMTETFAGPHADRLVRLALGAEEQSAADRDCAALVAREAWVNHRAHLSAATVDSVQTVLCRSDLPD